MPIVTTSVKQLVDTAKARIEEIPATDALALAEREDVVIVDIRDVRERQKLGFIPQSVHAPRGVLEFWVDPDSPITNPYLQKIRNLFCTVPLAGGLRWQRPRYWIWGLR